jgi:integrase/recombinase XerD
MPRQPRPDPGHLRPYLDSFALALRAAGKSSRTVQMYVDGTSWFAGWAIGHVPAAAADWATLGRDELRAFFAWLFDEGYSKSYVNNIGRCVQQFFKWYSDEEEVPNPFDKLKPPSPPKIGEKVVPVISPEMLTALIKDAEAARDFESCRDAAILRFFACTGVRLSELAHLLDKEVDLATRSAVVTGKGAKQRTVKFDHKCATAIDRYRRRHRVKHKSARRRELWLPIRLEGALTPKGVYQMIERRGQRLGIKIYPHMFRHTFSHNWLDAGGAEGDLMELNGWDSPQMLRHYGASARSARARRAYDRIDVMRGI